MCKYALKHSVFFLEAAPSFSFYCPFRAPVKCREIFILGCVDGLSYKEVSEKMGVSVNTVKTQIKLAYRKLKLELGGQNFVWEWTAGGVLFILMQK